MNKLKNEKLTFNEVWEKIIENSKEYGIKIPNDLKLLIDKTIDEFNFREVKKETFNPVEKEFYKNLKSGEYKVDDIYNDYVNSVYYKMDNSPKTKKEFFSNLKFYFNHDNFRDNATFYQKEWKEMMGANLDWHEVQKRKQEYENIWWCKVINE